MIQERESRFVVAHASGRRREALASEAIVKAHTRSRGQPVSWYSDGWRAYPKAIRRAYRRPVRTGRHGRPPLRVPEGISLTQTIKHRDEHGQLLSVEIRATIGAAAPEIEQPVPVHIERLNRVLRDRLACLTRKTHAFAKRALRGGRRCWGWRSSSTTGYEHIRRLASRAAPYPGATTSDARQRWP